MIKKWPVLWLCVCFVLTVSVVPCGDLTSTVYTALQFFFLIESCQPAEDEIVTFLDDQYEIMKPASWSIMENLHDSADFQMGNYFEEAYVIILTDEITDFGDDMTAEDHAAITLPYILESLKDGSILTGPTKLTVNGMQGVQHEITGVVDDMKIIYLHTTLISENHIHQIVAWSIPSKYDGNLEYFIRVIESIAQRNER